MPILVQYCLYNGNILQWNASITDTLTLISKYLELNDNFDAILAEYNAWNVDAMFPILV